jgi:hypothetical protein
MQESRNGQTNITNEYLIYPFNSPIGYNTNYTGTYSKYSIIDKFYTNSLVKPVKRLYYGGAEWSSATLGRTFSLTSLAYTFADEILFKTASNPNLSVDVADLTYDRIDAIVINEDGFVKIKKGTPSLYPKPPVLAEDEVLIQYALIKSNVNKVGVLEKVYENNGQWATSAYQISGTLDPGDVNFQSTIGQYISTYCISATTDYRTGLEFTKSVGTIQRSDYASLSMRVRLNNELEQNRFLSVQIYGTSSNYVGTASSSTINLMAYGLEPNIVGEWQHVVVPTIKFGNKVESVKGLKVRMIGGASASKTSWDLDYILFQTGFDYDEYMDPSNGTYVTSTSTSTSGGGVGGGSYSLTVKDYSTGASYTDINNIVFRGNTVVVTPGGLTAMGVAVTEDDPVAPGSIMVWIPAPNYVNYFTATLGVGDYSRYVMNPTSNTISGVADGEYSIGSWNVVSDFNASTKRSVKATNTSLTAFTTGSSFFSLANLLTSMTFTLYAGDGSVLRSISTSSITGNNVYTSSPSGLTLTITSWAADNDRWKAKVSGTINVASLFPYGGRFNWKIEHNNSGIGPGSNNVASPTLGVYSLTSDPVFYDVDLGEDTQDSSSSIGSTAFDEKTPTPIYYSGVAYYDIGSSFGLTVSGIDLLNDITIPDTKQIDINTFNMAIAGTLNGYADGSKAGIGTIITGWTTAWDKSGLTFSRDGVVNTAGLYIPNYTDTSSTSVTNTLDVSKYSYIESKIYDLGLAGTNTTGTKKMLFDTVVSGSVTETNNPLDSEVGRLSFSGLSSDSNKGVHPSSGTILGTATFSSTIALTTATDELQYSFGRVIYPQTNFTEYFPLVNLSASVNYSALSGVTKTFDIYTSAGLETSDVGAGGGGYTTTTFTDFKWHVTSYANGGDTFVNGLFTFNANFRELDMERAYNVDGSYTDNGTPELAILMGVDSTQANSAPDRFAYLSGSSITWGARLQEATYNFNGSSTTKQLRWSLGQWGSTINCRKVWIFIGYRNVARGKQLWLSDINLSFPV